MDTDALDPSLMNQEQLMKLLVKPVLLNKQSHNLWLAQHHSQVILNQLESLRSRLLTQASQLAMQGSRVDEIELRTWLIKAASVKSIIDKLNECNFTENDLI